jgi:hypothetical protein
MGLGFPDIILHSPSGRPLVKVSILDSDFYGHLVASLIDTSDMNIAWLVRNGDELEDVSGVSLGKWAEDLYPKRDREVPIRIIPEHA